MKITSVRDFRLRLAEFVDGREPILITRHGDHSAVVYPLHDPRRVPPEIRRRIYLDLTASLARQLGTTEDPAPCMTDPVVAAYKRDVDRTLIRENLRRTGEERLRALEALQKLAEAARLARPGRRK